MKQLILLFLSSSTLFSAMAQQTKRRNIFLGFSLGQNTFMGNNFIRKTYKNKGLTPAIDIGVRVFDDWGLGAKLEQNTLSVKTGQYVGNSTKGEMTHGDFYVFHHIYINDRWVLSPKIGIGDFHLTNTIRSDDYGKYDYGTNGTSYFVRPEINYLLNNRIAFFADLQYRYINLSKVNANEEATGTSYHSAAQLNMGLGVKVML